MEFESSLPYSQQSAICPYPEPATSSSKNKFPIPGDPSWYCSPTYIFVSPVFSFPQASPTTTFAHHFFLPYMPHAQPILFFSILSPAQYLFSSTDFKLLII